MLFETRDSLELSTVEADAIELTVLIIVPTSRKMVPKTYISLCVVFFMLSPPVIQRAAPEDRTELPDMDMASPSTGILAERDRHVKNHRFSF